jgi:hypothetical protein
MKLIGIILDKMVNLGKSQKKFFFSFVQMMLSIQGKINFRSLSRYSGLSEKIFRRRFKKLFDFIEFNALAIQQLGLIKTSICSFDASFL